MRRRQQRGGGAAFLAMLLLVILFAAFAAFAQGGASTGDQPPEFKPRDWGTAGWTQGAMIGSAITVRNHQNNGLQPDWPLVGLVRVF